MLLRCVSDLGERAASLLEEGEMNGEEERQENALTYIFRDKQSTELNISSPNNARNNSLS